MPARAFVFVEIDPADGERFEQTFAGIATGPGDVRNPANILLRDAQKPGLYIVVSERHSRIIPRVGG